MSDRTIASYLLRWEQAFSQDYGKLVESDVMF